MSVLQLLIFRSIHAKVRLFFPGELTEFVHMMAAYI